MQRSRLKNIINKSKTINNQISPFDEFTKSIPKEIQIDNNYRLEAAWKAYGSPVDYKHALWEGLIQPIDDTTYKLPSIGYNEETNEYEYLNKGESNDIVNKDLRVWDNDVIPFVKELKLGGFIKVYNHEKDCWTYKKGGKIKVKLEDGNYLEVDSLDEDQKAGRKPIGKYKGVDQYMKGDGTAGPSYNGRQNPKQFQDGGKTNSSRTMDQLIKYANSQKPPFIERILNNDNRIYKFSNGDIGTHFLNYDTYNGKTYVFPEIQEDPAGNLWWYKEKAFDRALERNNVLEMSPEEAELFVKEYKKYYPNYAPFKMKIGGELNFLKSGGQMNVIPEGALHARKNNMELAKEGEVTHKGIPVVDKDGNQQAEVEKEEWTMSKELTDDVEKWYKKFYSDESTQKEKDEIAIKCGKRIVEELLHNTDDRVGLIEKLKEAEL